MSIAKSAMHLANGEKVEELDQYQVPKKKRQRRQRNEKGQFIPGNTAALKWTEEKALELAQQLIDWMKSEQKNFLMGDFLIEHDLYADLIADLSGKYPRFAEHIARAREIEAHRIQKFALTNNLNPGMAQWVLAVNHGKHNVQKQELDTKVNFAPPPVIVFEDCEK